MQLESKKIVLTGASSGIGKALLELLLRQGALVVVGDLTPESIPEHPNLHTLQLDVSKKEKLDDFLDRSIEILGNIDVFIANAGFAYYEKIKEEDWKRIQSIFEVNTFAPIYIAEKMNRLFPKGFHFIVVASAANYLPLPGYALYSATKSAVHSFIEAFRFEMNKKSKLTVVYPIATKTEFYKRAGRQIPVPWPAQSPETVARSIVSAIRKGKKRVFPSLIFRIKLALNRWLPFLFPIYRQFLAWQFRDWERKNRLDS